MIDPSEWTLPDPKKVLAVIEQMRKPSASSGYLDRATWSFTERISPLDLYCYLKSRFGEPNGFAMTLRSPSVDNFIHWNYTLACGSTVLDLRGLDVRTELTAFQPHDINPADWEILEKRLAEEFECHSADLRVVRQSLDRWHLFINPYHTLRTILERQVQRLTELDLANVAVPADPRTREELPHYQADLARCQAVYQEAMALTVGIHLTAPILGESAVNFLMLLLAKPDVRADRRVFEDFGRRNIDVRLKSLHLVCDGFASRIEGSEEQFKEFLRLMNKRNDRLHGNVDPTTSTGHEVYFDHRFIPLFPKSQGLTQIALDHALANVDPTAAIKDWETAREFVSFLLSKLEARIRPQIEMTLNQQQLGYRPQTKSIGAILPQARVDLVPGRPEGYADGGTP